MLGNALLLGDDGYQISRSVRLRSSAVGHFTRTVGTASNRKTWTWSGWIKRGSLGSTQRVYSVSGLSLDDFVRFNSDDRLMVWFAAGGGELTTQQVFRDPAAWYHVVYAVDSTQATSTNRVKLYVNGSQVTSFSTSAYPVQNADGATNAALAHFLGRYGPSATEIFDGYITDTYLIDGQQLDPSYFGKTDPITGVWTPKKYAGTYGTNGFYLNFSDNSAATAAAIGKDYSGNGNNWTPNNISVTSGATYDSMLDVPTAWADGGNGRGNYCVGNPIRPGSQMLDGNLRHTITDGSANFVGSIGVTSGKWYWEIKPTGTFTTPSNWMLGVSDLTGNETYYRADGNKRVFPGGTASAYGATWTSGDTIGVALDMDAGTVTFYKNNASQGALSIPTTNPTFPIQQWGGVGAGGTQSTTHNYGQQSFSYTPPTGFKALNTQNLPDPTIKKGNQYFDATVWTGSGANRSISNSGSMQPDLVWVKDRSAVNIENHWLTDSVRGATKYLSSNLTDAEYTFTTDVTSFDAGGFSLGTDGKVNRSGDPYVGWQWKKGATPGFDIVTYTGDGAASKNISHALGVAPSLMIAKSRSAVNNWRIYHAARGATKFLEFTTGAEITQSNIWNNTAPTSSVFTVGADSGVNGSGASLVAYLFSEVAGFSKMGVYSGTGVSDGAYVHLGFRARFILIKRADASGSWIVFDTVRSTYNVIGPYLLPDTSGAEGTTDLIDVLSNGFKCRSVNATINAGGGTYVYAAFAENPFKYALAR